MLRAGREVAFSQNPCQEVNPALAAEANSNNTDLINQAKRIDASLDGWRKKECQQGAALNNVMALLHDRAIFHDAINVSAMRKSALAIKQF
jgi:hypothetical protein